MEKHNFIPLIEKYLDGTATEPERQLVEEYLEKLELKGNTLVNSEHEQKVKEAMWRNIRQHTGKQKAKVIQVSWYRSKMVRLAAAVAAACVIFIVLVWKPWQKMTEDNWQTISVASGSPIQKVILSDGTLVWVKSSSSVRYPNHFEGNLREIHLEGEALFEVAKDPRHPFIVHSKNMDVQVVGTSFNIRDVAEKDTVEIAVLTGRVLVDFAVQNKDNKIAVTPNYKLLISKKNGTVQKAGFHNTGAYTAGTEYDMKFVNTPLDSIAKKIENKFDVTVLTEAFAETDCRVSGDFTDQPLTHTIDLLCKTLGASCSRNQDTIRISGLKCR